MFIYLAAGPFFDASVHTVLLGHGVECVHGTVSSGRDGAFACFSSVVFLACLFSARGYSCLVRIIMASPYEKVECFRENFICGAYGCGDVAFEQFLSVHLEHDGADKFTEGCRRS